MPSPVFADTGTNGESPPKSSGTTCSATSSLFSRSTFASGLSILFIATTIGTSAARACEIASADEDHDVGRLGAARAHRRERGVARRVEEGDGSTRRVDVVGADVLRDAARLAGGDAAPADVVEERRLAVIDVAHHGYDRGARLLLRALALRLLEERLGVVELGGQRGVAHLLDD